MRLKNYDYSSPGAYFITICTRERRCILSQIVVGEGLDPPALQLTIHGETGGSRPSPTVFDMIGAMKSLSTRAFRQAGGDGPLWQRSYYDHIVRNEEDYRSVAEYIDANPARWAENRFFTGAVSAAKL